jgi:biuret amidohydrolase
VTTAIHVRGSDPYPWPYDGRLDPRRLALVVAGAQPAWVDRSVRVAGVTEVIDRVARAVRSAGGQVVFLRHLAPAGARPRPVPPPAGCRAGGLALHAEPDDTVVDAAGISGFYGSPLDAELRRRDVDQIVFAGFGAEAAVDSTLRAANDRGYECLTLVDGVAPFDDDTGRHALSSVTMSGGIFGALGTSDDLIDALNAACLSQEPL